MPITTLEDEYFRLEQGREYASKIEHLKKEARMLRNASMELYVDLDNSRWRSEHVPALRNEAISSELGTDLLQPKSDIK